MFYYDAINNPVELINDDSIELGLSTICSGSRIFIKNSINKMASSPLLFWNVKTEYFPQIKSNNNFYEGWNSKNHLAQVQFIIASEYEQYERKLFSIVDLLVQAGGSFNSLRAIGLLITAIFSYRLFYASLIRALFHFDTTQVEWESEFKKAEKKNKKKKKKSEINLFEEKEKKEKEHSGRKRFESFDDCKYILLTFSW